MTDASKAQPSRPQAAEPVVDDAAVVLDGVGMTYTAVSYTHLRAHET